MPTARAVLCDLIAEWSDQWHALTIAAEMATDPAERARLLAMAEGVEECDLAARRTIRHLVTAPR